MKISRFERNWAAFIVGFIFMVALVIALASPAHAGGWMKKPKMPQTQQRQDQRQGQEQRQRQNADARASSRSAAESSSLSDAAATSNATGGNATGGSNGDQISTNTSQFYALSLMFPGAVDCFTGVQGGAQDANASKGTSGFLGFHLLNKSCWLDKLASQETDIRLNARLKCGDKKYRNAIAYDVRRRDRQATCISMKVASGQSKMAEFAEQIADLQQQNDVTHERIFQQAMEK